MSRIGRLSRRLLSGCAALLLAGTYVDRVAAATIDEAAALTSNDAALLVDASADVPPIDVNWALSLDAEEEARLAQRQRQLEMELRLLQQRRKAAHQPRVWHTSPSPDDPFRLTRPHRTFEDMIRAAAVRHRAGKLYHTQSYIKAGARDLLTDEERAHMHRILAEEGIAEDDFYLFAPPMQFDPRTPNTTLAINCPLIGIVRDQGDCDASWAAAVASAFSDRLCSHSNGTLPLGPSKDIAIEDMLSCCGWQCGLGCNGGYSVNAWEYLATNGGVTGGAYGASGLAGGCLPYALPPCTLYVNNNTAAPRACSAYPGVTQTPQPQCNPGQCTEPSLRWDTSKSYAEPPKPIASDPLSIATEIFLHGSVTTTIDLYQDFLTQLPGSVYLQPSAYMQRIGALTVKLLGYGIQDNSGKLYWLAATTWGASWHTRGFFRIQRGANVCNVESSVVAAMPVLEFDEIRRRQALTRQKMASRGGTAQESTLIETTR